MSLLFTIVYAAHANGTHHKLALDSLRYLENSDAEKWRRVFLANAEIYLTGSKAPDTEFKDFKNHVLHVRDGYWGGAPGKARNWYQHLIDALRERDFARAVYAAGVLSHYYTDPIHPFHTGQTAAENEIHRAVEWSINRDYNRLRAEGLVRDGGQAVRLPEGADWLALHVCAGAELSNQSYERLIAHYDLRAGVTDPPSGLDPIARQVVADLIVYAAKGFGAILDRAFAESGIAPPDVSLTAQSLLAALKIPAKWVTRKIEDAETRRQVEAMYDELMSTGRVEDTLPEDDRAVRDLFEREVLAPRREAALSQRAQRIASDRMGHLPRSAAPSAVPPPAAAAPSARPVASTERRVQSLPADDGPRPADAPIPSSPQPKPQPVPGIAAIPGDGLSRLDRKPRVYLNATDQLEAAPSIGPVLASKLAKGGIQTVAQFLSAQAAQCHELIGDSRISQATVEAWQHQARLVMSVPGLRGTHAQLLVGAGFTTARSLADADPAALSAALLNFAVTPEGNRILRSGDVPDVEAITRWVQNARDALAA